MNGFSLHIEPPRVYFFEVNTTCIPSSVLKTSEFSRVRSTNEFSDLINSRDEIDLVFTPKKKIFLFYTFYRLHISHPLKKAGAENAKTKILGNSNNVGTKIFVTF